MQVTDITHKKTRVVLIAILGLLTAIGPFSIDMYLPGFPAMAKDLHTSINTIAYSLSSFFIGLCVGQLISGPLLDRYGRKRPLIIGLVLYIAASIGCVLVHTSDALIALRFVQALGCCVSLVAPRAITRDVFPLEDNAKVLSLLILLLGVSPILAPTFGSYVVAFYKWQDVFIILALIAAITLAAVVFLFKESRPPDTSVSLKPRPILNAFGGVLKNPQFFTYAFVGGVSFAGLFAYLSGSPFLFMEYFGVSKTAYGAIFAIIAAGLIGSSQLNAVLLKKYSSEQLVTASILLQTIIGFVLLAGITTGILGLYGTIAVIFLLFCTLGISSPNTAALSILPFSKEAGSASALLGALQMGLGALAAALTGVFENRTPTPIAIIIAASGLLALVILLIGQRWVKQTPAVEAAVIADAVVEEEEACIIV
ncbi:multidrug effflux MFS transporter [Niabella soli]|uniref:multidrug effflux MFS transporter n=1 Tax=Niabella soli TaxID=446683 RepID=UPI000249907E|nr:multidrug effflux MFS transporter [Niabella soli]